MNSPRVYAFATMRLRAARPVQWMALAVAFQALAGCLQTAPSVPTPANPAAPSPAAESTNLTLTLCGTLAAGASATGVLLLVAHRTHVFLVPDGALDFDVVLAAAPTLGDLDFHLVRPDGRAHGVPAHTGTVAAPDPGRIHVTGPGAVPGNWTVDVHSGEGPPASGNTETSYRVAVSIRVVDAEAKEDP